MKIEIEDEVWDMFKRSWALMGVRTDEQLVRFIFHIRMKMTPGARASIILNFF